MPSPPERRLPEFLSQTALFLAVAAVLLRLLGTGGGTGTNLFLNVILWLAIGVWFMGRALAGGVTYRRS